jgi:uncharacterized membrane protein YeaQ/YmgE (transglycosylase-associated protein family)
MAVAVDCVDRPHHWGDSQTVDARQSSWIITMLLGLAGSFVASYQGRLIGWYREGQLAGFIRSVLGVLLILYLWRLFAAKQIA